MAASPDDQHRPAAAVRPGRVLLASRPQLRGRAPLPVAAAVAALWAALLSAVPVTGAVALAQLADAPSVSMSAVARYGLGAWLLGHGVPLGTGVGPLGLAPLAVTALAAWRVVRAGVHTTRAIRARHSRSPRSAVRVALAVGGGYGLLGAVVAALVEASALQVSPGRAALTLAVFGAVAAGGGALWATGAWLRLARRVPAVARDGVRTGAVAALLVLAAGAALAGTAIAVSGGDAGQTLASYRTGVAGQAGLTLVCLAYAPNVAIWGASYLVGPGFALGVDSVVRTSEVSVGALPALPLVAALPSGPTGGAGAVLLGAPVLAGLAAGALFAREQLRATRGAGGSWQGLLGGAVVAGPVAGALLGLAAQISGGPLGAGRLAVIGPVGWQVALISSAMVAAGTVLGAAGARTFLRS